MKIGSLFSGIGGLELGLERAGLGPTLWQVEADPSCRSVLARHWPDAERYDDVRTFDPDTAPPVQILCGGFPCQDVSGANPNAVGLTGARSGLWFEFLRIIEGIRPGVVVVENVPGLVRRGLGAVVRGLVGAGYRVEGSIIGADDVGAPHRRKRLFLLAYANQERGQDDAGGPDEVGCTAGARPHRHALVGGCQSADAAVADARGRRGWSWEGRGPEGGPQLPEPVAADAQGEGGSESGMGGDSDGVSRWLDLARWPAPPGGDRLAYWRPGSGEPAWIEPPRTVVPGTHRKCRKRVGMLGNAVCPQVAYVVGMRIQQVLSKNKK